MGEMRYGMTESELERAIESIDASERNPVDVKWLHGLDPSADGARAKLVAFLTSRNAIEEQKVEFLSDAECLGDAMGLVVERMLKLCRESDEELDLCNLILVAADFAYERAVYDVACGRLSQPTVARMAAKTADNDRILEALRKFHKELEEL